MNKEEAREVVADAAYYDALELAKDYLVSMVEDCEYPALAEPCKDALSIILALQKAPNEWPDEAVWAAELELMDGE